MYIYMPIGLLAGMKRELTMTYTCIAIMKGGPVT